MKTDDPRLEKIKKEMLERVENMDKLTIATLRSHLLAEQCMNDYIIASGVKRRWLRKKSFWDKMQKCKLLAKDESENSLWGVMDSANQLRNAIGHTLSMNKIADKMTQLKEKYLAALTEKQSTDLKDQPDDYIAQSACLSCAGFIASLQSEINNQEPLSTE